MLFLRLKEDRLEAFKAKDEFRKTLLATVIGESTKETKEPNDEQVTTTIKSFIKNARVLMKNLKAGDHRLEAATKEIEILQGYLPSQLTGDALKQAIVYALNLEGIGREMKEMKNAMAALALHYPDRYDGKEAGELVKQVLTTPA